MGSNRRTMDIPMENVVRSDGINSTTYKNNVSRNPPFDVLPRPLIIFIL